MSQVRISDQEAADCCEALWRAAFEGNRFATMCTLLRVDGLQDAGWDPFEESEAAFKDYNWHLRAKSDDLSAKSHWRIGLLMYCQACEMSAVHDTLANLLAIAAGGNYRTNPLGELGRPKRRHVRLLDRFTPKTAAKWDRIRQMAQDGSRADLVRAIDSVFDGHVRNAFSHSSYVIGDENFRWREGAHARQKPLAEVGNLISNAFAFFGRFIAVRTLMLERIAQMPRYHRWPDFAVLELLKTDGRLDGFQVHFSTGAVARFKRSAGGVEIVNMMPDDDGMAFQIGNLAAVQQRFVVGGQAVDFGDQNSVENF